MKVKTLSALAGIGGAMILSGSANAAYTGLFVDLVAGNQTTSVGQRDVYRVYATFSNAADRVNAWYGITTNPLTIQNILADGVTLGSGFTQIGGAGGNLAPAYAGTPRDWDTYATIGVRHGDEGPGGVDATSISPGFPSFIAGNSLVNNNMAVFVTPPDLQGNAGWVSNDGGPANAVMLMQLTVAVGQHVRGTISIDGILAGTGNFTALNQTFNSIPAPGAFALLGLAGLVGGRRRRTA